MECSIQDEKRGSDKVKNGTYEAIRPICTRSQQQMTVKHIMEECIPYIETRIKREIDGLELCTLIGNDFKLHTIFQTYSFI